MAVSLRTSGDSAALIARASGARRTVTGCPPPARRLLIRGCRGKRVGTWSPHPGLPGLVCHSLRGAFGSRAALRAAAAASSPGGLMSA